MVLRKLHLLGVRRRSLVGDVEEGRKAWTERDMGAPEAGEGGMQSCRYECSELGPASRLDIGRKADEAGAA